MKETPTSPSTSASPAPGTPLTHIRIVVAGLGQTVLKNGAGSVSGATLSCIGTTEDGQTFDTQGDYDITATQAHYANAGFIGGLGTPHHPWRFQVSGGSD